MAGAPPSKATPGVSVAARRGNAARLFGYDIFISFALGAPPRGSRTYAADLARRLREADFTVFFSEEEAPAGGQLDTTLERALLRSRTLVVVLNRGTLADPRWVRTEVETFRRARPGRLVVPISIGGAITDPELGPAAQTWLRHGERIWIDEQESAWREGAVSDEVLARLTTAPRSVRATTKWRALVGASVATLAAIAAVAWIQRSAAVSAEARARDELRRATALRLVAESEGMLAGTRTGGDERAMLQLVAAHRLAPGAEVAGALLAALLRHRDLLRVITLPGPGRQLRLDEAHARLYVAVAGHGVLVFEWPSGRALEHPPIAAGETTSAIALSDDGSRLATVGVQRATVVGPDGRMAVAPDAPSTARLWDLADRQPVGERPDLAGLTTLALAFTPDGSELVAAGPNFVRRFDARSGASTGRAELDTKATINGMAIDAARGRVASGGYFGPNSREVRLWDLASGKAIGPPWADDRCDTAFVAFGVSENMLISGGGYANFPNAFCLLSSGGAIRGPWEGHGAPVSAVAISEDGSALVSGAEDGGLLAWLVSDSERKPTGRAAQGHRAAVRDIVIARKNWLAASTADDRSVRLWPRGFGGSLGQSALGETASLQARVPFNWDGTLRFGGNGRDAVYMIDPRNGRGFGPMVDGDMGFALCVAYSPDGLEMLGVRRGEIVRWRVGDGRPVGAALQDPPPRATCVAASPDGRVLAATDAAGRLHLWDAASGRHLHAPIAAHDGAATALRFSADSRFVVTGGEDARLQVWDVASASPRGAPMIGSAAVRAIDIDPAGATLVAGDEASGLQFWDLERGRPIGASLPLGTEPVRGLAFSADGRDVIVATGSDHLQRVPAPLAWADRLCAKLTRNPTETEWREWISSEQPYITLCPAPAPH